MPPRVPFLSGLRALNGPSLPSTTSQTSRTFSYTSVDQASSVRRHRDPYALAQARARKAANISRQQELKEKRSEALGDPVRGVTTPFVQSFDTAAPPPPTPQSTTHTHTIGSRDRQSATPTQAAPAPDATSEDHLNFYLSKPEVHDTISHSELLIAPVSRYGTSSILSNEQTSKQKADRDEKHATATEALRRIASLANGSSKDRLRVNIQRCISTFGRHTTDSTLPPKPALAPSIAPKHQLEKLPRAGPDTGSSEVQAAILTAKIRTLADFLETRGHTDKVNKRNLRVLVHKRQKLLTYLRRKERGGPRWQNLIETLGLTEGTWKGEISL